VVSAPKGVTGSLPAILNLNSALQQWIEGGSGKEHSPCGAVQSLNKRGMTRVPLFNCRGSRGKRKERLGRCKD